MAAAALPSEPDFGPVVSGPGQLRVEALVPSDLAHFAGHFPGHPIVPGFAQLVWVEALARRGGLTSDATATVGVEALKFRAPLFPRSHFRIAIARQDDRLRFTLEDDAGAISQGRLVLGAAKGAVSAAESIDPASPPPGPGEPWPLALPHAGNMRWVTHVLDHQPGSTTCRAVLPEPFPFGSQGSEESGPAERVSMCVALELLAQAMAAHGGLAASAGGPPRRGMVVSARRLDFAAAGIAPGERLWVRADHLRGELGMVAFRCALGRGKPPGDEADAQGRALAAGTLGAQIESLEAT